MRKLGKRITGAVLAATMLVFGSDITVLAADTGIVLEDAAIVEDDTDIIDESDINDENDIIDDTDINDENDIIDEDDISDDSEAENPAEDDFINEENSENPLSNEDSDADIILEEETVCEENLEGKKSKKDDHIDCSNIKTPGLTLIKTADEIEGPKKNPRSKDQLYYVWDCIYFGSYVQTDTDKDGKFDDEKKEPIKWRVLSKDENNVAYVVSDKVLDLYTYNALCRNPIVLEDAEDDASWNESKVRSWLNGLGPESNLAGIDYTSNNFIDVAFSDNEKKSIRLHTNTGNHEDDDEKYNSEDRIFFLSREDVYCEELGFNDGISVSCEFTDFASRDKAVIDGKEWENEVDGYWLRTEGYQEALENFYLSDQSYAYCCEQGAISGAEYSLLWSTTKIRGVRPAMYIDLDDGNWSYATPVAADGMEYKELTVHFDPNGGYCDTDTKIYSIFTEHYDSSEFPIPTREGYHYKWKGPRFLDINDYFETEDDVVFKASWTPTGSVHEVIFKYCDGITQDETAYSQHNDSIMNYQIVNEVPNQDYFLGWYTKPEGGELLTDKYRIIEDATFFAHWDTSEIEPEDKDFFQSGEMWTSGIEDIEYSGKAYKPPVRVYYGYKKLKEGRDYSIKYFNIKDVKSKDATDAPTITIVGKGNYEGKETIKYNIVPKKLSDESGNAAEGISVADMLRSVPNSSQRPVPSVKFGKTVLKEGTDFECSYFPVDTEGVIAEEPVDGVSVAGKYVVRLTGKGKFDGTLDVNLYVSACKSVNKLTVSPISAQKYNFEDGHEVKPSITVKDGKNLLAENVDYIVDYADNTNVGIGKAVIIGMGNPENGTGYVGTKTVTFKIDAETLGKLTVNNVVSEVPYDGKEKTFENVEVYKGEKKLTESVDYEISYLQNINAGTANVVISGIGGYRGTFKKTFKITPLNIHSELTKSEDNRKISLETENSVVYTKSGAKAKVTLKFSDGDRTETLIEGRDYTLKYSNNSTVNDGTGKKIPTVTIKGKGNYAGSEKRTFVITGQLLKNVSFTAENIPYANKTKNYKNKIELFDSNGKKLAAGKDYDKKLMYCYGSEAIVSNGKTKEVHRFPGEKINSKDIINAGAYIRVTVKAKGKNYSGTKVITYQITPKNIADVKVTVPDYIYTGKEIRPGYSDIKVEDNGEELEWFGRQLSVTNQNLFTVIGYSNNIKAGTATLTIKGYYNYSGTKTVKFKIKKKPIIWWNRD